MALEASSLWDRPALPESVDLVSGEDDEKPSEFRVRGARWGWHLGKGLGISRASVTLAIK